MSLTGSRRIAVALSSTAMLGLSAFALPGTAGAVEIDCDPGDVTYSVTGGTIGWGVKTSFRNYVTGFMAHGHWTLGEGVTFSDANGQFVWPITSGAVNSETSASASGEGSVAFYGHSGAMDLTMSNPTVELDGTEGELKLDYRSKVNGSVDDWYTGAQTTAVKFEVPADLALNESGTVTIASGATIIEDEFVDAMGGFYGPGSEMDPVSASIEITATCAIDPGEGEPGEGEPGEGEPGEGEPGEGEPGDGNGTLPGDDNDDKEDNTGSSAIKAFFKRILGFIGS